MDRSEYLAALDRALRPLTLKSEREEILRYYTEYFDEAGPEGEAAVIGQLGDPRALARATATDRAPGDEPRRGLQKLRETPVVGKLFRLSLRSWKLWAVAVLALVLVGAAAAVSWQLRPVGKRCTAPGKMPVPVFSSVQVDARYASVAIRPGSDYQVELSWNKEMDCQLWYGVRDGVLHVYGDKTPAVPPGELMCQVLITIPHGTRLDRVVVNTAVGNMETDGLDCRELAVSSGNGFLSIRGGAVTERMDLYTGRGQITFTGIPAADTTLETLAGGMNLGLQCMESACSFDLRTTGRDGTIRVNDVPWGTKAIQYGEEEAYRIRATAEGSISAYIGKVYITYGDN